jgi:hypothetical protein
MAENSARRLGIFNIRSGESMTRLFFNWAQNARNRLRKWGFEWFHLVKQSTLTITGWIDLGNSMLRSNIAKPIECRSIYSILFGRCRFDDDSIRWSSHFVVD